MARIVNLHELKQVLPTGRNVRIVLTGGCFDIFHIGHVRFLSEAKKMGDYLAVLLESDKSVRGLKGKNRPIFLQIERAEMLSAIGSVDLVVLLPMMRNDSDYLSVVMEIKPHIIAVTEHDPRIEKKRVQAKKIGARVKVIPFIERFSTSRLAKILGME